MAKTQFPEDDLGLIPREAADEAAQAVPVGPSVGSFKERARQPFKPQPPVTPVQPVQPVQPQPVQPFKPTLPSMSPPSGRRQSSGRRGSPPVLALLRRMAAPRGGTRGQ